MLAIKARAEDDVNRRQDPQAYHALALIELLGASEEKKPLQRAISSLWTAARLDRHPGPALADLSAAYLVRAEQDGSPRDLLAAMETADEALELEPRNMAARFNLALALQRFGLVEEAAEAWRQYLSADPASQWAARARSNLRMAQTVGALPPPPANDAPAAAYAAYTAADPQGARTLGWCRILGAWGEARLAGDGDRAARLLRNAKEIGMALEKRRGGDATLGDAVRAIQAVGGTAAEERLARGHVEFNAGCAAEQQVDFPTAARRFHAAAAAAGGSPPLAGWARMMYGGMRFRSGDMRTGEAVLRQVCAMADPARHPALAASARLALSALLIRADRYDPGLQEARRAAVMARGTGETETYGVALDNISIAYFHMRDMDQGYAYAHQSLEALRPYRSSFRLHNMLGFAGQTVADDGFPRAGVRMLNEGVRVAERTATPVFAAEAHLIRARLLAEAGAHDRARHDMAAGDSAIARLAIPGPQAWMGAQRRRAAAAMALGSDARSAADALDSAAAFFSRMRAPLVAFPTIVASARARLTTGDATAGTARLDTALRLLEHRRDSVRMEPRRAAIFNAARDVVEQVVMLKLAAGNAAAGLAYLDWGRASLAPVARPGRVHPEQGVAAPPGEVALEYAVKDDTLLAWAVTGRRVELYRTVVDTAHLFRTIVGLQRQLEARADEATLRPRLAELYEQLVRPLERWLGAAGTPLVVVADGDLASVPFAALWDRRRESYLVEDRPLRFAPSLSEAGRREPRRDATNALFVADPAFDRSSHPQLPRLADAAVEVQEIAAAYPRARTLSDTAATAAAVRAAVSTAGVFHYAGHAVFDDDRPERSYLLLASGNRGDQVLQAMDIAQLDLRDLSLVVLAACQTVRTGSGQAAGFSGLAGAFLAAGAGGAVGGLWEVDDRLTRPLMIEFHRAYRATGNGPEALRRAQLRLLGSADPALHSPAAWSGFRYVGN